MAIQHSNNHNGQNSTYLSDSDYDDNTDQEPPIKHSTINVIASPTTDGDLSSAEHTPTTSTHRSAGLRTPAASLVSWTSADSADYVSSLGLPQYADMLIDEAINGEALIEMHHQDFKDIGISSLGHRLTILKGVYELKISQQVPLEPEHYVPLSAEGNAVDMSATQDDIARVIDSIRMRDQRILSAETELRVMKDDLNRILDENRKLREETLPLIRLAKDKSHPLPNPEAPLTTPPPDLKSMHIGSSGLSRKFSTKRLFLGSAPKNTSPTTLTEAGTPEPGSGAFLSTPSNVLQHSPAPSQTHQQHSPTSPAYTTGSITSSTTPSRFGGPLSSRDDSSYYGMSATYHPAGSQVVTPNTLRRDVEPPLGSAPLPTSANSLSANMMSSNAAANNSNNSSQTRDRDRDRDRDRRTMQSTTSSTANNSTNNNSGSGGGGGGGGHSSGGASGGGGSNNNNSSSAADDNIEIFKSFRVSIQDPCREVLPVALKRYNINEDWRQYALYIVHGDQERCLGLDEKPLMLFKQLDREGRKPMFMLRKHATPAVGWSSENGGANKTMSRDVPGGVL